MIDSRIKDARLIVSTSGGKDSTAMCLKLMEQGYTPSDYDRIFFDTGWEHKSTYEYLDSLEKTVGPIFRLKAKVPVKEEHKDLVAKYEARLGYESPMIRKIFWKLGFPRRRIKWCTDALKINPAKKFFEEQEDEYINVVGIRKEESTARRNMSQWEWSESFDCWIWRPIINWSLEDVIAIHRRFNLSPNPLYLAGSARVGCWPCINSRKKEINRLDPARVELIRDLEQDIGNLRGGTRTFFQSKRLHQRLMNIDEVMDWAATSRGGKQIELFSTEEPGCVKWGLCNV